MNRLLLYVIGGAFEISKLKMVLAVCNVNRSVGTIWDKSFGLDFFYKIIEAPNDVTIRHFSQVVLLFAIYGKLKKFKLKRSSCAGVFFI